jgi:alpha-galactosidase
MDFKVWGASRAPLRLCSDPAAPVSVSVAADETGERAGERQPLVEVLAFGHGRRRNSLRMADSAIGSRLRLASPIEAEPKHLEVSQIDQMTGLAVSTRIETLDSCAAYRATTTLTNSGTETLIIQSVSSIALSGMTELLGSAEETLVWQARNEWCSESRWYPVLLESQQALVDINPMLHGETSRCMYGLTSSSNWSSGSFVPMGALVGSTGAALVWQLEVNGPWRWEIISRFDPVDPYGLVLLGPTDLHHSWVHQLEPGESFTSVPVSFAVSRDGLAGAMAELTWHRRAAHVCVPADTGRPLVFNDYMNTLMGDPTAGKLLPLIEAAASVGAQVFCIDAGWYDDDGDWWPSVGAWEPSRQRFGAHGLGGVLHHIRDRGMKAGLWIEPEVIGVNSTKATELSDECFMRRDGRRIEEHQRYFLDFRAHATREYLDSVFERLISGLGVEYFKWDNNVTPGTGPKGGGARSPGDGLLEHSRAQLAWFDALRARYPAVIFEACSSGAQRMDQAILSRFDLQSTSDQQDYRLYPPIAASAPMAMAPEQAANWSYPIPGMRPEQVAFTLVTGLSGRLYLSGRLNELDRAAIELVREATAIYPSVIRHHSLSTPFWPLGLPSWSDPVVALGSLGSDDALVAIWNRLPATSSVILEVPAYQGRAVAVSTLFPTSLPTWPWRWDQSTGHLHLGLAKTGEAARLLRLVPVSGVASAQR